MSENAPVTVPCLYLALGSGWRGTGEKQGRKEGGNGGETLDFKGAGVNWNLPL